MKILVVCQHFYPEQFRINDICFELVNKGHFVTVLTGLPNYPYGKVLKDYKWFKNRNEDINGVKVKRCSLVGRGKSNITMAINYMWFAIFGSIKALFMKKDFDVIYAYQLSPITMVWPAILIKKIRKIPLVINVLDQWPISVTAGGIKKTSLIYKILFKISKRVYQEADKILISSRSFKKYFIEELKLNKEIKYIPQYAEKEYENVGNLNNRKFDLLFAGNIGPVLSVETIVETANLLKNNSNIKFHIVGDGLSKEKCENLAKNYNLKNIKFYGYYPVNKMREFYNLADAFLITMVDHEVVNNTLPAKLQSYMLAGKPIIGAINGEVKRILKEADCGLCCDAYDFKRLADLILKASSDKEKLKIWGNNAYKYYLNNFEKNKIINNLIKELTFK